jgi:hypothetical protein
MANGGFWLRIQSVEPVAQAQLAVALCLVNQL